MVAEEPRSRCGRSARRARLRRGSPFHHQNNDRRQTLIEVIAAGIAAGHLPANLDPEMAALALAGAITYCRLMTDRPFPSERVEALVELVIGSPATRRVART